MMRMSHIPVAALVALAACGGARVPEQAPRPSAMGHEAAVARARADSLRYAYTAADIDFMSNMIHHHAQAIVMAKMIPTHGASAAVQRLGARIINAQEDEITLMQSWLRDRLQAVPVPDTQGTMMDHAGHGETHAMPGMLSSEQMKELDAARGEEFDHLFLRFMIEHHRGAVAMVRTLFESHGAGQDETIFKFASDVEVDQSTEIKRMLQMLIESPTQSTPRSS